MFYSFLCQTLGLECHRKDKNCKARSLSLRLLQSTTTDKLIMNFNKSTGSTYLFKVTFLVIRTINEVLESQLIYSLK